MTVGVFTRNDSSVRSAISGQYRFENMEECENMEFRCKNI